MLINNTFYQIISRPAIGKTRLASSISLNFTDCKAVCRNMLIQNYRIVIYTTHRYNYHLTKTAKNLGYKVIRLDMKDL